MLHVNEQPIKARCRGNHANSGRAQMMHAKAKGEFAFFQAAARVIRSEWHGISPLKFLRVVG
jgi:hypothetical protein